MLDISFRRFDHCLVLRYVSNVVSNVVIIPSSSVPSENGWPKSKTPKKKRKKGSSLTFVYPSNPLFLRANSPILSPYFSYKSTVEKLLKYQENSPWVIISFILMTSGVE